MSAFKFRLRNQPPLVSVEDWRLAAKRKLPAMAWAYIEGGADDLVTLCENMSSFRQWRLRQRCLTGIAKPELSVEIAGARLSLPVALAPTGTSGLSHWSGDIAAGRAAEAAGSRMILSNAGSYLIEEVADATEENHWFQLYPFGNRNRVKDLISRARSAGYTAMFVTVDVPVVGNREDERRWHFYPPWTVTPSRALHLLTRLRWVSDALKHKRLAPRHYIEEIDRANAAGRKMSVLATDIGGVGEALDAAHALTRNMQGDLRWDDLAWMRDQWKGPLYVKGIVDPDDAARAVDEIGAQGVVVSNHGGRQLDRCLASIDALPAVVDRIGDRADVFLDGGVRRGTDVITALALGARAVFVGRPYLYALAAGGEAGVGAMFQIFREEMERALVLMGCPSVGTLDRSWLHHSGWCKGKEQNAHL